MGILRICFVNRKIITQDKFNTDVIKRSWKRIDNRYYKANLYVESA